MTDVLLSSPVNSKLGKLVHSWSLTPGIAASCPGESQLCRSVCYAMRGRFRYGPAKKAYAQNFEFSQTPAFTDWASSAVKSNFVQVMRIHVSGDFYDAAYVHKWGQIARACPKVTFFAYTRSWRDDAILPALLALGSGPNVQLWWSIDRETGPAPLHSQIKRAYMAMDAADAAAAPQDCDLVFRVNRNTVLKRAGQVLVCPPENGVKTAITCSTCGVCWRNKQPPTWIKQVSDARSLDLLAPAV